MKGKSSHSLKIVSYNIHKGFGFRSKNFVLPKIREALSQTHADIVFLQEVLGEHADHAKKIQSWPTEPQFEYIADTLWPHFSYGKNAVYSEGHHGNAILSKFAIREWENINISTNRFEQRGMLHAVVHLPHKKNALHLVCLHLDLLERGRTKQIQQLCNRIQQAVPKNCPLIIAGDFNDWRQKAGGLLESELDLIEAHYKLNGFYARTFPSWSPFLRLDRIYVRGVQIDRAEVLKGSPWDTLSDHAALTATVSW